MEETNKFRLPMRSITLLLASALLLSAAGCVGLYMLYRSEQQRNAELTAQMEELSRQESRSAVMQSINAQMEEIAIQERRVSDMQREEAIQQRKVAEDERRNAERQRREAEEQRQNALTAERKAVEASDVAERQRAIAEQQRTEAEAAKRVTDTLSYNALTRNLGTTAMTLMRAGNSQMAEMLAYTAYMFTQRYQGDIYNPAIYEALSLTSSSIRKWNVGRGAVMKMMYMPGSDAFITVSTYGEIRKHTSTADGNLHTETVMEDSRYDFRDMYIDKRGTLYALSNTGHLLWGKPGSLSTMVLDGAEKPFRLFCHNDGELIVVAEKSVHLIDCRTMTQSRRLDLSFSTRVAGEDDRQLLLFDLLGHAYTVDNAVTQAKARTLPFTPQPIMSYTFSKTNNCEAFGTVEGTIFVVDGKGNVHRLVGHGSRVSRVKFVGDRLYSTSYDGTVRFWPFTQQKIESIAIADSRQWVVSIFFEKAMSHIWTGDQNGNITQTLIDAHLMAERVRGRLKRNLTPEEWQYYIGRNVPYETFFSFGSSTP